MKKVFLVAVMLGLSVGAMGQSRIVSKAAVMEAHAILARGDSLTGEQMSALLAPVKDGERVALFAPENLRDLDGELRHALGVDTPLRACRADELKSAELTMFIRAKHGGYCKASLPLKQRVKYAHVQQKAVIETPATITYSLNPEASQAYAKLEEAKTEVIKQFNAIAGQQMALLVGAGIPASERDRQPSLGKDGIVSFAPKSTPKPEVKEK